MESLSEVDETSQISFDKKSTRRHIVTGALLIILLFTEEIRNLNGLFFYSAGWCTSLLQ